MSLDCIGLYSTFLNESQTKAFLVLKVEDHSHKLAKNIEIIDRILSSFGAPAFYEVNACFCLSGHSFLWFLCSKNAIFHIRWLIFILHSFSFPISQFYYINGSIASFELSDILVAAVTDKWMPVPESPNQNSVVPTRINDTCIESSALALLTYGESDSDGEDTNSDKVSIIRLPVFSTILLTIGNRDHLIECGNKWLSH
jgi:hypothetical protein